LEAVAMLAYSLEPEAPSRALKDRLMNAVGSAASPQPADPVAFPQSAETPRISDPRDPVDRTLHHAAVSGPPASEGLPGTSPMAPPSSDPGLAAEEEFASASVVPFSPRQYGTGWMTAALAAALALCLVGLGYFYSQVNQQRATLAVQQDSLDELSLLRQQLDESRTQYRAVSQRLAMVNTVSRQAYPMEPTEAAIRSVSAGEEEPFGRVFVCGQHQRWYLTVSGLEPAPIGQSYHLWYVTEQGPVDAGVVEIEGGVAGLQNLSMPDDTSGFRLTLEPEGVTDAPRGSTILIGESPVKL
ncbi:MAG: anti-sigma factor, partial [Acidobacteriota bacterium]